MRILDAGALTVTVKELFMEANFSLPSDVKQCILNSFENETWPGAKSTLEKIMENFTLAEKNRVPVCQDTGMACVFLEIGRDVHIEGDIQKAVDEGIRLACACGNLRASVVSDPLRRVNTGDNTPAMLYIDFTEGDRVAVTAVPKGFGSENMSRIGMLGPSEGKEGIVEFVVSAVESAGPNPCPPVVLGIGIGGTFDKAALAAKKALLRPLGSRHGDPFYAALEDEILKRVNALGIGPQGFGGGTTALSAAVEVLPAHIASLPCAVNINCHVSRHAARVI
ncbi:MAG: fumarate hydratase [Treponema sp.]|jgi:fumarate hydratase subunit alpha|nr:fumarate hydratase [Treponema sp.]